ncbi:amphi-Trp domain-containing protein [Halomarina oriensis]|uniref:Amphi-Trp domain-containing protein n=1 Tax=Halomarina oriensis TaxID=671145 RepID=A0A6B0GJR0_9EURY|nr:hypothetical protein [Halomarina oriensis]MWG35054.1 hypothetical protein [Halomarina oriensis]
MSGLNTERVVTRAEAADYLREFADKLAGDGHAGATNAGTTADTGVTGANTTETTTTDTGQRSDRETETRRQGGADGTTSSETVDQSQTDTTDGHEGTSVPSAGKVTFLVGNDSATVNPPEEVTLDVSVGEDSSMMSSGAETVTFSLRWDKEAVPESDELRIE